MEENEREETVCDRTTGSHVSPALRVGAAQTSRARSFLVQLDFVEPRLRRPLVFSYAIVTSRIAS